MTIQPLSAFRKKNYFVLFLCMFFGVTLYAQQTNISDYVLFGGKLAAGQTAPAAPGYGVQIGSTANIQGGSIGSYNLVKSTGNLTINGNVYSGGKVELANSNTITGRITAANSLVPPLPQPILSVGSSANIGGNIDVNGNIVIGGGTVSGRVTHPLGTSYSGPVPGGGNITGPPSLPGLPAMPAITNFPAAGTTNINSAQIITPNSYGNITLNGNKTLTFSGTGVYVFNSISNSGTSNNFVFDFKNNTTGTIKIYVYGNIDLNKVEASVVNGGSASRIFCETHGTGTISNPVAFKIANGSSGQASKWLGSVWAPYAAINVGSGTGSTDFTGALWSGTQINIQSGVTMNFAPFIFCSNPPNANAGPDKPLDFVNQTVLNGSSTTPGVTFSWSVINGGVITSPVNAASITVSAAGTYILTVTSTSNPDCVATDTAIVTGKVNDIIGSELMAVLQNFNSGGAPSPFFEIQNDKIFIDVIVKQGEYAAVKGILTNSPWNMTDFLGEDASSFIITGLFSISKLAALNTDPVLTTKIVYVRPYYRAFNNALDPTGLVITQGDTSVRAHLVRKGYELSGDGIKIGVISNSFNTITAASTNPVSNTASQDVGNKDLPGPGNLNNATPVTVLKESPFVRSDEGRAMLQIIHDIAPKAELYFWSGVETANDFAAGIRALKAAGCNIITDDLTYITEPFLKDGVVAGAVAEVTAAGATYITSAGNFANKSIELPYNPMPAPGGLSGTAHNFSGGDAFLNVSLFPGDYTIVLQWLDDIYSQGETANNGTKNDLDIYLTPNTNGTALFGFNRNNLNGDPIEFLPFTLGGTPNIPIPNNILIINNTTTSNPARFKVVIFKGRISFNEYVTGASTIIGQSNAAGAITVGAARFDNTSAIETFSSAGGTVVGGSARNKPDLVAPDGVNTTVNMGIDQPNDPDPNFSNFLGTSAAAPHVAGVTALIMEGKRKFLNQTLVPPAEIKSLLQSTSTDMGAPGFDFSTGSGFINADAAMRTFAAPDPSLIQLVVPSNVTPGPAPFTLTVTGLNLSPTSVVKLRDVTLPTTFVNSESATAQMPAFIGDPAITVFTPPKITNGIDGGTSETLKFFGVQKKNVVVKADNKSKKYAQSFPAFTATITVDGVLLSELPPPGLTLQQLGLDVMIFTSSANNDIYNNVGTYTITPGRTFDNTNPVDIGLQELYNYTFTNGELTIEKLPVTLTAQNLTAIYGEKLPDIAFSYAFTNPADAATIPDPTAFLNAIQSAHQSNLAKDAQGKDILGLVNGQAVTIENGQAVTLENGQAVTIENGQAVTIENNIHVPIVNAQGLTIVNGVVTDTSGRDLTSADIANLSFLATTKSLQNTRQITNKKLVNGTYVTESTNVVDITQESILDFNVNAAQTSMLNSLSNVREKGLVDKQSYENGQAVTIENGQAVTIENGQAVTIENAQIDSIIKIESGLRLATIINGQAVTIENGQAVTIENGQAVTIENGVSTPLVNSQNRTAVIVDKTDIGQAHQTDLMSVNMITGLDVGNQFIIPGALVNSNLLITNVAGIGTILPAQVIISPDANQSKVYGTQDPVFTFTNNAGLNAGDFTGALSRVSGNNVGTYNYTLGNLSAGANYTLALSTGAAIPTFAITAKSITITPDANQSKVYGDADPIFTYTASEALLSGNTYSGALGRVAGNNVGNYAYTPGTLNAGNNYILSLAGTNTFAITKASLQVKAGIKVIFKGDPLPTSASTVTVTGLKNGDNPALAYTTSPTYSLGSSPAGVYTIIPSLQSFANADNYTITYINGTLYVNPKGPGAKKLIPKLDCVVEIINPSPGQFRYIARFTCDNNNATPVYVLVGPDNNLSSNGGSFNGSAQPVLFNPGITAFEVPFDGIKLIWVVKTFETNHKTSVATEASSTSGRCSNNNSPITATVPIVNGTEQKQTVVDEPEIAVTEPKPVIVEHKPIVLKKNAIADPKLAPEVIEANKTAVYPNPGGNRIIVSVQSGILSEKGLLLYDVNGRSCTVKVTRRISQNSLELDVSLLRNGFYLIKIKSAEGYRTFRFVKG